MSISPPKLCSLQTAAAEATSPVPIPASAARSETTSQQVGQVYDMSFIAINHSRVPRHSSLVTGYPNKGCIRHRDSVLKSYVNISGIPQPNGDVLPTAQQQQPAATADTCSALALEEPTVDSATLQANSNSLATPEIDLEHNDLFPTAPTEPAHDSSDSHGKKYAIVISHYTLHLPEPHVAL